jgi:hypothetical protein
VRWRPDRTAVTTGVGLAVMVVLGAGYVVHTETEPTSSTAGQQAPASSPAGSPGATTTSSPSPTPSVPADTPLTAPTLSTSPTPAPTTSPTTPTPTPTPTQRLSGGPVPSAPAMPTGPGPATSLDFTLTTFNMLGASHTATGGTKPWYASGPTRAHGAAELIRRHGSDVVGFQELQTSQLRTLRRLTNLDFYPGSSMSRPDSENSLGWRRDRWVAVEEHVVKVPYFDGGLRAMPVVRLRSRSTGLEAWFANFHNPADTRRFHRQQAYRLRATALEIRLANRLIDGSGLPVFITGDMNERAGYFCRLTSHAPMLAARGGSNLGRCLAGSPRAVDWIFGSQGVDFTGYNEDRSHLVDVTTDHPVVSARVRITGRPAGR